MKKTISALLLLLAPGFQISAQNQIEYYLPKTELRFKVLVETQVYTPGEFAVYSEHYLKKKQPLEGSTQYRLLGVSMQGTAIPDQEKRFSLTVDQKHSVLNLERNQNGVMTAVNCEAQAERKDNFTPHTSHLTLPQENPHDYMSQEILSAGSTSKMAELTAREIYDIRESRNQLSRGEADFMPKDGEQLRLMMQNLDKQEHMLLQTFEGTTARDTSEVEVVYTPYPSEADSVVNTKKDMLFRFSKWLGVVDVNDLAGEPYYISITNLLTMQDLPELGTQQQKKKEVPFLAFNLPGKIDVSVSGPQGKSLLSEEIYVAQYGKVEHLPQSLFGKKILTKVQVNPVTGYIEKLETQPIE